MVESRRDARLIPRRRVVAGSIGVTALALPSVAGAASVASGGESSPNTVPAPQSLLFHLDAN
jgi:hypothetical protein